MTKLFGACDFFFSTSFSEKQQPFYPWKTFLDINSSKTSCTDKHLFMENCSWYLLKDILEIQAENETEETKEEHSARCEPMTS